MTVNDICRILSATPINIADGERTVTGGYAGDLLSFVMGRAPAGCVWFTVMTNVNVCAVASLADVALVVLCEDSVPMDGFTEAAAAHGINAVMTKADIFTAIKTVTDETKI